jgi:hypothetical protein
MRSSAAERYRDHAPRPLKTRKICKTIEIAGLLSFSSANLSWVSRPISPGPTLKTRTRGRAQQCQSVFPATWLPRQPPLTKS